MRTCESLSDLIEGPLSSADGRAELVRLATHLIVEEALEAESRESLKGRTQALEELAVELPARGLSVRDIEDAFRDESGRLLLSRTAVSEIGERLWADYREFAERDLSEYDIAYLFVDGIAARPGPRTYLNACSSRSAGGSRSSPTRSARRPSSSACSAP